MVRCAAGVEAQPERKQHSEARIPSASDHTANVWPVVVVVLTPGRCRSSGMGNTGELFDIEQLISQATIEALGVAVLPGATWCYVQRPDSELL